MDRKSQLSEPRQLRFNSAQIPANAPANLALIMGSIVAVLLLALPAFAQTAAQQMLENASAKSFGDAWECKLDSD